MTRWERLRYERGLTRSAVIKRAGVSHGVLVRLERDGVLPPAGAAKRLADLYEITVAELIGEAVTGQD